MEFKLKPRTNKGKLFALSDESVVSSVIKFGTLDQNFKNKFQKFVLVINVDFKDNSDLQKLVVAVTKKEELTKKQNEFVEKISTKTEIENLRF